MQRVTKYPLLLARLYKVTPCSHPAKELLLQAQHHIELHLEHMNSVRPRRNAGLALSPLGKARSAPAWLGNPSYGHSRWAAEARRLDPL